MDDHKPFCVKAQHQVHRRLRGLNHFLVRELYDRSNPWARKEGIHILRKDIQRVCGAEVWSTFGAYGHICWGWNQVDSRRLFTICNIPCNSENWGNNGDKTELETVLSIDKNVSRICVDHGKKSTCFQAIWCFTTRKEFSVWNKCSKWYKWPFAESKEKSQLAKTWHW